MAPTCGINIHTSLNSSASLTKTVQKYIQYNECNDNNCFSCTDRVLNVHITTLKIRNMGPITQTTIRTLLLEGEELVIPYFISTCRIEDNVVTLYKQDENRGQNENYLHAPPTPPSLDNSCAQRPSLSRTVQLIPSSVHI